VLFVCALISCARPEPPRDPAALQRSCDAGALTSCVSLAYDFSKGEGVTADAGRAAALYEKACRGGLGVGCVNLGVAFALGSGVPVDRATAARLFRDGCLQASAGEVAAPVACVNLGVMIDGGFADAAGQAPQELFERACRSGYPTGCRYAGLALAPREPERGKGFIARACERGDRIGCEQLDRLRQGLEISFDETLLFAKVDYHY
jgi:uncharacterized protein